MNSVLQQSAPKEIKVKILLAGGHEYTLFLQADAPLLQSLVTAVVARSQKLAIGSNTFFQIPLNEGRAALCFASESLVGLVTEPPVFIQQLSEEQKSPIEPTEPAPQESKAHQPGILPSPYIQLDNFFSPDEYKRLLAYVAQHESDFVSTSTSTDASDYRRSMVLYSFPEFSDLIVRRIQAIVPDVLNKLGLPTFTVSQIETQLTSHNDGNYYKIHNDNGSADTDTRELTYVYYFYREPKPFVGGELRLYDSKIENNFYVAADSFNLIEPRNNSIVFFPSRCMHEVLPVSCPSKAFADSRFTINGWIRR
jgi:SM-20-related protein